MENLGYYNGRFGPIEEMTIPMNDRVCWFGDGVYDAAYSRNHIIFTLKEHVDRFFSSAALLGILIPHDKDELLALLSEMVRKVDSDEQFVYWQVTRGAGMRSHTFSSPPTPGNLWITLSPRKVRDTYEKVKLITRPDTRFLHCNIKTLNLIPTVMAATAAAEAGCYEAVFHREERVTECSHSNVHIIKDGIFRTAPADNLILPGIARANLISYCERLSIPVDQTPFTLSELMGADEVIVSSSGAFCLAASEIDNAPVGGRAPELLRALQDTALNDFLEKTNLK